MLGIPWVDRSAVNSVSRKRRRGPEILVECDCAPGLGRISISAENCGLGADLGGCDVGLVSDLVVGVVLAARRDRRAQSVVPRRLLT